MFKKIDKENSIVLREESGSTIVSYTPSFTNKQIKLLHSILTFNAAVLNNCKLFDVFINDAIVDQIKIDENSGKEKICIEITDEIIDLLRTTNTTLEIKLNSVSNISDKTSFEIVNEYLPAKQWLDNNVYQASSVKRAGNGKLNLASGALNFIHNDVNSNSKVLPMSVSHIFNSFNINEEDNKITLSEGNIELPKSLCGKGWKLNYEQYIVKERPNSSNLDNNVAANYTYVKEDGSHVLFQQKYYYKKGEDKIYLKPNQIKIDLDKTLHFMDGDTKYEVKSEIKTDSDYILTEKLEGFDGINLISRESEEIENIKLKIKEIDKNLASYKNSLEHNLKNIDLQAKNKSLIDLQYQIQDLSFTSDVISFDSSRNNFDTERKHAKSYIEYLKATGDSSINGGNGPSKTENKTTDDLIKEVNSYQAILNQIECDMKWGKDWENKTDNNFGPKPSGPSATPYNLTFENPTLMYTKENIIDKTGEYNSSNYLLQKEQLDNQSEQLEFEKQQLNEYIEEYGNMLKKLIYQLNEYEKQMPEIYISNKDNSQVLGFAKFRKESLYDIENGEQENNNEIYRLVAIVDQYENSISVNYEDSENNECKIKSIVDNEDNTISFEYNNKNLLGKIIDDREHSVSYEYDTEDNLIKISYSDGTTSEYEYANGNLTKVIDGSGYFVEYKFFDTANHILLNEGSKYQTIKNGEKPKCWIDSEGNEYENSRQVLDIYLYDYKSTKVEDRFGNVRTYLFDEYGRPVTIYDGEFNEESPEQMKVDSITHDYKDNKLTRKTTKIHNAKNLLNVYSENYLGDDIYLGDDVYTTLLENPADYNIYQINSFGDGTQKVIEVGNDIVQLLNTGTKSFIFSAWAKADAAYTNKYEDLNAFDDVENLILANLDYYKQNRKFELKAELTYSDTSTKVLHSCFDWMQTNWQYAELPIEVEEDKTIISLKLYFDYSYNTGTAKVFGLSLQEAVIEKTEYNKDKLPTLKYNSLTKIKISYDYNDKKLTKELISFNGKEYINKYTYNKKGSLIRSVDYKGIVEEQEFNDKGQVIKTSKYNLKDPTSKFISTTNLDEKGKQLGSVDEFGEELETFEYANKTGVITGKKDKVGNKTSFGYDPETEQLTSISSSVNDEENCNIYGYTLGLLTKLSHNGFDISYDYNGYAEQTAIKIAGKGYANINYLSDTSTLYDYASGEKIEILKDKKGNTVKTDYSVNGTKTTILENSYDKDNNLTEQIEDIYNKQHKYSYSYDKFGNQTYFAKEKIGIMNYLPTLEKEIEISNQFNKFGNVTKTQITIDDAIMKTEYVYDNGLDNKLQSVKLSNDLIQKIEYDHLNRTKDIYTGENLSKHLSFVKRGEYASNLVASEWFGKNGIIKDSLKYSYDNKGNITKICENSKEIVRYTYDALSRLIREDNKKLDITAIYEYDAGGNLLFKKIYKYTQKPIDLLENASVMGYNYGAGGWKDQLLEFNGQHFVYDNLGNPTTYRDKILTWGHLRNLEKFGEDISYTYNASGIRTSKTIDGKTTKFYLNGNKIVAQDNGNKIYFHYGIDGIVGFTYKISDDIIKEFYYKKNIQGDILSIYDANNNEIVKYVYDAWGSHKTLILSDSGEYVELSPEKEYTAKEQNNKFIAELNPFRYRGYYYDTETWLYYLNSRYYDPELGRFINADNLSYLDPNKLNGLNLYSCCGNNPVNYLDFNGNIAIGLLIVLGVIIGSAITGGTIAGIESNNKGNNGWGVVKDVVLGAFIGIAVAGAGLTILAGGFALFGVSTVLGVSVATIGAIGILSYNFVAMVIAPIFGFEMQVIEFGEKSENKYDTNPIPSTPKIENTGVKHLNLFNVRRINRWEISNILNLKEN